MNTGNGHPLDPVELASMPADHPYRQQAGAELTGQARLDWEQELALTDRLRAALPDVPVPAGLETRLLAIAAAPNTAPPASQPSTTTPPASPLRTPTFFRPTGARIAAGLILLAGLAALYFLVIRQPAKPVRLDQGLAQSMAALAINHHETPLEIASSDEAAVQKTLAAHALDFPVLILKPSEGTLKGGGTCDFGAAKAAFTRWDVKGQTYTLYEFNGKALSVPSLFYSLMQYPRELWQGDRHYQVFLFPGTAGKCCWALVMEKEDSPNVFAQYGASY